MRKKYSGQGLIEVVFSIGIIILALTAVIALMVSSLRSRTVGFDRKKAAELGQRVVEELIEEKKADPLSFWNTGSAFWVLNLGTTQTMVEFPNYNYAISFTEVSGVSGCTAGLFECAEAKIGVGWSGSGNQNIEFSRFFSKK